MRITIIAAALLIGALILWLRLPCSPIKKQFQNDVEKHLQAKQFCGDKAPFTREELSSLPVPIRKYMEHCGYIGTPKMSYLQMVYHNVRFMQGRKGPQLTIDYTQYNFVDQPVRLALIDSSLWGIPFEGYDSYQNGTGGMKGVLAKGITLFDQTGKEMDRACLATYLAEALFAPAILLRSDIVWKEISPYEVQATMTYGGQTVTGLFTFNEQYEMVSFSTNDRAATSPDGTIAYIPWLAQCGAYQTCENGIKRPTTFQAVWRYPDGDFVYFDGQISKMIFG